MIQDRENYTIRYFKENLPDWKRRKDSFVLKYLVRPMSFAGGNPPYEQHRSTTEIKDARTAYFSIFHVNQ